tara:strand:+ start:3674 stop:3916 length:243 start_codon:yes stop_codon:yes gene_type:complete
MKYINVIITLSTTEGEVLLETSSADLKPTAKQMEENVRDCGERFDEIEPWDVADSVLEDVEKLQEQGRFDKSSRNKNNEA